MGILDFAMQMELDGKAFYEQGARKAPNDQIKDIMLRLAEEEMRHYHIFKSLKEGHYDSAENFAVHRGDTIGLTKSLFKQMTDEGKDTLYGEEIQNVWREAMTIEEKSEKMYREEAEKTSDEKQKKLLNKIADEEKNHIYLIDNMMSFMADPKGFVDSQNFRTFLSWEGR